MKLQLAPGTLRLRVTRAEFDALRAGSRLGLAVAAPGGRWQVDIASAAAFSIELRGTDMAIAFPQADLDALRGRLPAREGLRWQVETESGPIALVFEVDIRDAHRTGASAR